MGPAGTFFAITAVFVAIEVIVALAVAFTGKKGHTALNQLLAATAISCCWIMWAVIYIAQLHPLVKPQLQGG